MTGRVLIIDDHPMCREAMALAVNAVDSTIAVEHAASIAEAEAAANKHDDFRRVLLDLGISDANGFSGLLILQRLLPCAPIAIVSGSAVSDIAAKAAHYGALGFVPKDLPMSELVASIRSLLDGQRRFPDGMETTPPLVWKPDGDAEARDRLAQLTPAQLRILAALSEGTSNKQIAFDLAVTKATVKAHLGAAFRKLGVQNRSQAILMARQLLAAKP